ncbi:MAG: hypothetical protein QY325_03745 [Flavobacteriales bacterium]|jgi:hypothetical protein|nr:MAG: hypothetical protein QY325_03745 [Flavobacteriales bacterium]
MRCAGLLLIILALTGCAGTRKQLEHAAALEKEGLLSQAMEEYLTIRAQRPREMQALAGAQRTAQGLFNRLQDKALAAYRLGDLSAGDATRDEAERYRTDLRNRGLHVEWDALFEMQRKEAIRQEAARLFTEAEASFRNGRYGEAEDLAARSARLDPERRDAQHLMTLARVEPIYQEGARAQALGIWREAYRRFDRVVAMDAAHKDALERREQCRQKASYTLSYLPILNPGLYMELLSLTKSSSLESQLAANVKAAILDLKDPFALLVDRDHTEAILAEQRRQMNGSFDEQGAVKAGRLLGARFVLTGRILRYDDVLSRNLELQMQLIETETGRIHASEVIRVGKDDLERGPARPQLVGIAARRIAERVQGFDPTAR